MKTPLIICGPVIPKTTLMETRLAVDPVSPLSSLMIQMPTSIGKTTDIEFTIQKLIRDTCQQVGIPSYMRHSFGA